jgi:exodeoxyribonuclease X
MNITFFDTETTGFEDQDRILQFAVITERDDIHAEEDTILLCKPPVPISLEAMSIHHITEKMVQDKPLFKDLEGYEKIKELFESDNSVCIAHNAPFDVKMIEKEGITPKNVICTYKVIRHLDPDGEIPKYKLQYLRYFYDIEVEAEAHDAMGDVLVLQRLFAILVDKMEKLTGFSKEKCIQEMIEVTKNPVKIAKFSFGKYVGLRIADVAKTDLGYLQWLHRAESQKPDADKDMLYTLEQFI